MAETQDRDLNQKPCLLASSKVHVYPAFLHSLGHIFREWQDHSVLALFHPQTVKITHFYTQANRQTYTEQSLKGDIFLR